MPNDRPNTQKPTIRSVTLMMSTSVPVDIPGINAPRITEIPDTPPVEKLLGNLKK